MWPLRSSGRWVDSYTGTVHENPAEVSIDHLVALKEAYVSGASSWSQVAWNAFGNDVERVGALRSVDHSDPPVRRLIRELLNHVSPIVNLIDARQFGGSPGHASTSSCQLIRFRFQTDVTWIPPRLKGDYLSLRSAQSCE